MKLIVTDAARELVVTSGSLLEDGARPSDRVVRRELLAPVSEAILGTAFPADRIIVIDAEEEGFVVRSDT